MSLSLACIHVYPIKSLGGFEVPYANLTDRGLEHDRRWMLVNEQGRFTSQREIPAMACLHSALHEHGFRVNDTRSGSALNMPWSITDGPERMVDIWDDRVAAVDAPQELSAWFSDRLGRTLHLVHMPDRSERNVDPAYARGITSFSDGFPYLIISQASLDELNGRIADGKPIPMERFRPNLVVDGGTPFQEDTWSGITIDGNRFDVVKPCSRCVITTTDQDTGERGMEPLRTLVTYRSGLSPERKGNVDFGMNAMAGPTGRIEKNGRIAILGAHPVPLE